MRQALDITYVLVDILRLLRTTAGRLSRYRAGSEPAPGHDAGPDQPDEEITRAGTSINAARAALSRLFREAYRASGGWPEPGGDPVRDGLAVSLAHRLCQRLRIADQPWPELSGTRESRDHLVEALICATDGLAWGIQNLARDAPGPMQAGLTGAVARLDDTFAYLREALIRSAQRDTTRSDAGETDRNLRIAIPLPGRARALRARNARSEPHPARTAAEDFPAAGAAAMRPPATARPAPPPRPGTTHADPGRRTTMDITNNERMSLAATAYRAYLQHAAQMELPLAEDATEDDILADLIAGLHHYADSRGIGFDSAVASGQAAYERHRAGEDNPYRIGDEVHLRQRPDTGFPSRGVVASIFPERDGEPTYHVRFPGQADTTPLEGREIGPAASFPTVTTNQGTAASLAAAERLLIETAARIRACEQRQVPPHDHDLADKDSLLLAIGNACALAGNDVLRHLEPQVAAWTDVITQPWHPVHVTSATELAALDFPQPVQASVLADPQAPAPLPGTTHLTRPGLPSRGIRHRRPSDTPRGLCRASRSKGTARPCARKGAGNEPSRSGAPGGGRRSLAV